MAPATGEEKEVKQGEGEARLRDASGACMDIVSGTILPFYFSLPPLQLGERAPEQSPLPDAEPKTPERGGGVARSSPNLKITVFTGSKGGTGKTTVLFHAAAQAAKDNPEATVLVIDCSFAGDLSERYLGGSAAAEANQTAGEAAFYRLHEQGKGADHLFTYLKENPVAAVPTPNTDQRSTCGGFIDSWRRFSISRSTPTASTPPPPAAPALPNVADRFGVIVRDVNPRVTLDNLYLIPGGGSGRQPCAGLGVDMDDDRASLTRTLLAHLSDTSRRRKLIVFFDTDGDLQMSTSMEIVLCTADTCVLFTESDPADFRRIRTFCSDLHELKVDMVDTGKVDKCATVATICFNKVKPSTDLSPFEELGCNVKPHLVAVRQLISSFSTKLSSFVVNWETRQITRKLFAHMPLSAPGSDEAAAVVQFKRSSFMVIQEFLKLGMLGSDLGVPFCCMEPGKTYKGEHGEYKVDNERLLTALIANIRELNGRL